MESAVVFYIFDFHMIGNLLYRMTMPDVDLREEQLPQSASTYLDKRSTSFIALRYSIYLEAGVCSKVFHEMMENCPLGRADRCTKSCQLGYRERNVEPDPCCRELKLCHKRAILLLFKRIGKLWDVFSLEYQTRRDQYLLRSQRPLDVV